MRSRRSSVATLVFLAGVLCVGDASLAQGVNREGVNKVTAASDVIVEPPTLAAAGFEWPVEGDANRNATVAVVYRKRGDAGWQKGLPLLRIGGERTVFEGALDYTAPHMFAGSLFGLAENTDYEVQFTLTDPDGVTGADGTGVVTRSVTLRTRAEPHASTLDVPSTCIRRATRV